MVDVGIQARGYFVKADGSRPARDVTLVPTVTIDALALTYGATADDLKIDVEGEEASVLAGARPTLTASGRRPTVFLELHNDILRARGGAGRVLQTLMHGDIASKRRAGRR